MRPTARRTERIESICDVCACCTHLKRCFLAQPLPEENRACATVVRRRQPLARGDRLFDRGGPFTSLYLVANGSIKTQRITPEGDLVVTGFFLPGDVVGLDAMGDDRYPSEAIALTDASVCRLAFERLLALCSTKPEVHNWIISRIGWYVRRKETTLSWSRGLSSDLRVLQFFLDLRDRLNRADIAAQEPLLPMKKQDIARYLHITPETLSRNLAHLRKSGLLLIENDRFTLPDLNRARRMTNC